MASPRIGTYNVLIPRTDHPEKGEDFWFERRDDVIATLQEEFDIVGLQECSFGESHQQGEYITEKMVEAGWHTYTPGTHGIFTDPFHKRLPIFWRPEALAVESAAQLLLSSWSDRELEQVPILENRYASFVKGVLPTGQRLLFFTLHLQHQTATAEPLEAAMTKLKRDESQRRLLTALMHTQQSGDLAVIAGDFNTAEKLTQFETAGLQEVSSAAAHLERWEHNSFHDWDDQMNGVHFDRIFVSEGLVGGDARIGESEASDHYPVSYRLPELCPRARYQF